MKGFDTVLGWARGFIDLMLMFIAVGVVTSVVFTDAWIFNDVVDNLMGLITQFGEGGVAGLLALLIVIGLYKGRAA